MVAFDRPLVHTLRVAARPFYITAVTVSRGTASADGVRNSSLPPQAQPPRRIYHLRSRSQVRMPGPSKDAPAAAARLTLRVARLPVSRLNPPSAEPHSAEDS